MASTPCTVCGSTDGADHICPGENAQLVGETFDGRYLIESILGQGGMGMVFKAKNIKLNADVAVKTLHPSLAAAPQFFERFRREAEIASSLKHPNIIGIYDFGRVESGVAKGTCYYVMELLTGLSLKQVVKANGPMTIRRAAEIVEQCALGLAHAHQNNAVHRDIKPHNIVVTVTDGRDYVKIRDFGLVKAMEQEEGEQLTSTGQVLGTPQYMPPEQAGGDAVDHRSDLYSLAGVFYYCLTGQSPFNANSVRKALQAALTQTVAGVNTKRQGAPVPRELEEFFRKGLAREKEDRHQSADDFIQDFHNALSGCNDEQLDDVPTGAVVPTSDSGSGSGASPRSGRRSSLGSGPSPSGVGNRASRSSPSVKAASNISVNRDAMTVSRAKAGAEEGEGTGAVPPPPAARERSSARPGSGSSRGGLSTGVKVLLVVGPIVLFGAAAGVVLGMNSGEQEIAPIAVGGSDTANADPVAPPKQNPNTVDSADPIAAPVVVVRFSATPDKVEVFEGDSLIGMTPMELKISRQEARTFTFRRDGFTPYEKKLDLARYAADTMDFAVAMKPVIAKQVSTTGGGSKKADPKKKDDISIFE